MTGTRYRYLIPRFNAELVRFRPRAAGYAGDETALFKLLESIPNGFVACPGHVGNSPSRRPRDAFLIGALCQRNQHEFLA
ncbi:MAG: hypothetical protein ABF616_08385 [Acetobacter malorum]